MKAKRVIVGFSLLMTTMLLAAAGCNAGTTENDNADISNNNDNTSSNDNASMDDGGSDDGRGTYVDTHMHVNVRTEPGSPDKNHEAAADNLLDMMDEYGVDKSLLCVVPSHTQSAEADYQDYMLAAQTQPDRLFVMAGGSILGAMIQESDSSDVTDELSEEFQELAEQLLADGARGFGEMLVLHLCLSPTHSFVQAPADHPFFLSLADVAADHDVPIDIHMEVVMEDLSTPENIANACDQNPAELQASIPSFENLLAHNPEAKIVWQHIGWDNIGQMTVDLLRELLEDHPNLYLALRVEDRLLQVQSTEPMPNRIVDENAQIRDEWLQLFNDFPDRFVIGSDEFVAAATGTGAGVPSFEGTWSMLEQLPADLAKKIGHDNAIEIYNLE